MVDEGKEEVFVDVDDDLGKLTAEDVKKTPLEVEAVVLGVTTRLALEVFGAKAEDPEKQMVVVEFENKEQGVRAEDVFSYYPKEKLNDLSKMGRFLLKFGKLEAGTKVKLKRNAQGFWKLDLKFEAP